MSRYLIATGNPHKTEAIRRLLSSSSVELCDLSEFPDLEAPMEDGESFTENALIKARYYCQKTGLPALADDSGLEIDALDGEPGIHSSRFAGNDTPHSAKMTKIIELLTGVPRERRSARFRCVAAVSFPDGREFTAEGSMDGVIWDHPQGSGGFGYDPIVYIPELQRTVAELTPEEKDLRSHRGKAFRALLERLQKA